MNEYEIDNGKNALKLYEETYEILGERFRGERDEMITQNAQMVLDGMKKIIMLKERDLSRILTNTQPNKNGREEK